MNNKTLQRFFRKVNINDEEDCWEWTASTYNSGYGQFRLNNRMVGAHRLSYEHYKGDIGEYHVLHKCDNKLCVNPRHLFLGTNQDNVDDKMIKGRQSKGEVHGASKLTENEVKEIISLLPIMKGIDIAKQYGISRKHVSKIKTGKIWKHISRFEIKKEKKNG